MDVTTNRIRAFNDELRRNLPDGHAVITFGVAALGPEAVARIAKTVAVYDDFCHARHHIRCRGSLAMTEVLSGSAPRSYPTMHCCELNSGPKRKIPWGPARTTSSGEAAGKCSCAAISAAPNPISTGPRGPPSRSAGCGRLRRCSRSEVQESGVENEQARNTP